MLVELLLLLLELAGRSQLGAQFHRLDRARRDAIQLFHLLVGALVGLSFRLDLCHSWAKVAQYEPRVFRRARRDLFEGRHSIEEHHWRLSAIFAKLSSPSRAPKCAAGQFVDLRARGVRTIVDD